MFGKDKTPDDLPLPEKAPTSFTNPVSSVVPKPATTKEPKSEPKSEARSESKSDVKSASTTVIAKDTEIFGDIKFSGSLEVQGTIVGNIMANPSAEASVIVRDKGHIEGDISVPKVMINGHVKGIVHSSMLELADKAKVQGDVHYQTIEMVKGAQVNGSLVYCDDAPTSTPKKSS